jgi:hypothetical protein
MPSRPLDHWHAARALTAGFVCVCVCADRTLRQRERVSVVAAPLGVHDVKLDSGGIGFLRFWN